MTINFNLISNNLLTAFKQINTPSQSYEFVLTVETPVTPKYEQLHCWQTLRFPFL